MRLPRFLRLLFLTLAIFSLAVRVSAHEESLDLSEDEEDAFADPIGEEHGEESNIGNTLNEAAEKIKSPPIKVETIPYVKPSTENLEFVETFDGDIFKRWIKSAAEKFTGSWGHVTREIEAITGDRGLRVMNDSLHHGISTKMPTAFKDNKGKSVVVSYEAKFEENLACGGAYLKLFDTKSLRSKGADMTEFDNETPYVVMFGPDRCGSTNKVHLIIKQLNPKSGKWVEHHLSNAPRVPHGTLTHLYQFVTNPDNTYSVLVDGEVEKTGSMKEDFEPPFTPPKEVDDPSDVKPKDWVDESRIPDPNAKKPDDWDEEAPREIPDPKATMPDGWLVDEEPSIPDPKATKPADWDDDEDGEWVAPMVTNPVCADVPGCGEWKPPMMRNPEYKGAWFAPLIDNPAYKGEWKPRQIPNKDYFVSDNPHALASFDAIGFELWTTQKGMLFDNIVVARSMEAVKAFTDKTWKIRSKIEEAMEAAKAQKNAMADDAQKMTEKAKATVLMFAHQYPLMFAVGSAGALLFLIMIIMKALKKQPAAPATATTEDERKADKKDAGKSSPTITGESEEEDESEVEKEAEKEAEILTEKKGTEQTRQRRAKKD